jgi:dihydrolipoamide dehydrogenase
LHSAEIADGAREGSHFGVKSTFDGIDMAGVNSYKDGVISKLYKGLSGLVKSRGITFIEGYGKLVAKDAVEVNGVRYTGKNVILATGSYAKTLPGLEIYLRSWNEDVLCSKERDCFGRWSNWM